MVAGENLTLALSLCSGDYTLPKGNREQRGNDAALRPRLTARETTGTRKCFFVIDLEPGTKSRERAGRPKVCWVWRQRERKRLGLHGPVSSVWPKESRGRDKAYRSDSLPSFVQARR